MALVIASVPRRATGLAKLALLATLAALLLGLVDVTRQWFVIFSTGVGQIDWHTVQVIILDAIVPLFLVWVVSLARYFQNEASQIYTPSPEDAAPYIAPRNLPDEKR